MDYRVIILLCLEALLALWLLYRAGLLEDARLRLSAVLLTAATFLLRAAVFDYQTLDYQNFLSVWVDFFRNNGGFAALAESLGNYNVPYMYFLALFSYLDVSDLHLIKLLSVFFDVILAWAAMLLVSRFTLSRPRRLACFFAVLFWPTVFLNGALWAQCDSVYVALALLGVALALDGRPRLSVVCAALSFGFKLQAVFILPAYAVLLFYKKLKWADLLLFPLTYVLLVLPAVLCGRPFMETLTLYLDQTVSVGGGLNYNSPSLFALISEPADTALLSKLAVCAAFAHMLAVLALCFFRRSRLTGRAVLGAALLLAVGIPFLLPHMHDRYFFAADVLTVAAALAFPELAPTALLTEFASLLGYHAYLKMRYLLPMRCGAYALIAVLILSWFFFLSGFSEKNADKGKFRLDKS